MKNMPPFPKDKDKGIIGTLTFLVVLAIFFAVLEKFLKYLFKSMTPGNVIAMVRETYHKKAQARVERYEKMMNSARDPLAQYFERFINRPERYKGDPKNTSYERWFSAYKKGRIPDPSLRWAPLFPYGKPTEQFLDYLSNQYNTLNPSARGRVLRAIRKYYPEFEPDWDALAVDLYRYRAEYRMVRDYTDNKELLRERLSQCHVNTEYIDILMDLNAKKYDKALKMAEECTQLGYLACTFQMLLTLDIKPDSEDGRYIQETLSNNVPERWILEAYQKKIGWEDVKEMMDKLYEMVKVKGWEGMMELGADDNLVYVDFLNTIYDQQMKKRRIKKAVA